MNTNKTTPMSNAGKRFMKTLLLGAMLMPLPLLHAEASPGTSLQVGDHFGGGKIAYILKPGERGYVAGQTHGLIAAARDLEVSDTWKNAMASCRHYRAGGNNDWRLPKKHELVKLYENRFRIGGFRENHYYWSGTESDVNDAWDQSFNTGKRTLAYKQDCNFIRPVRSF
jgi:Protein of unknown function (DUF1566)